MPPFVSFGLLPMKSKGAVFPRHPIHCAFVDVQAVLPRYVALAVISKPDVGQLIIAVEGEAQRIWYVVLHLEWNTVGITR